MRVPPVVTYRPTGGPAYLVAWEKHPDRTWWARLLWIEIAGDGYTGRHARVTADDVAPIPGQDYRAVPRRGLDPRSYPPSDPTDPRDPSNRSRNRGGDRYREALERARHRGPEPDF
ncbi:hypothetical protein [Actinomadura decatromicini]|uniref:Uncharacterized protein n=1 Tax=Actinomadura decatromicini TaxID=2604572 RepID=A0A5D3FGS4_9ACTN|nr:hypothetical protein [Actinomadura decatromicini]TYK47168.1 hypothetical protein FXF68_25555 [Actinomadura decatromicini]